MKDLASPHTILAIDALEMLSTVDAPRVRAAVEEVVVAARRRAETTARRLRTELAEIETRLTELRITN